MFANLVQAIQDKIAWCRKQRSLSPALPTVPSTIDEEKLINPFMRVMTLSYSLMPFSSPALTLLKTKPWVTPCDPKINKKGPIQLTPLKGP